METPLYRLTGVRYRYMNRFTALDGIDLEVTAGESVALLGANGCGKSTLLKILDGLIIPGSGEVHAYGRQLTPENLESDDFRRFFRSRVGFLFQNPEMQLFSPTVYDDIAFGPLQLGLGDAEVRQRVEEMLAGLGIADLRDRSTVHLSGGEKKKVALASVLATDPEVLLLDEPGNGLDPRSLRWLIDRVVELRRQGKTIITATHDLLAVDEIASRVVVLGEDHRVAAHGRPGEILADMELLLKANLIDSRPYAHAHLHYPWHTHPHPHGGPPTLHHHHDQDGE